MTARENRGRKAYPWGGTAEAGHEDYGDSRPYVGTRCGDRKEKRPPKCGALVCPSILAAGSVSGRRSKTDEGAQHAECCAPSTGITALLTTAASGCCYRLLLRSLPLPDCESLEPGFELDEPRFDEPRLDEPRFDESRFDDPIFEPTFDEPACWVCCERLWRSSSSRESKCAPHCRHSKSCVFAMADLLDCCGWVRGPRVRHAVLMRRRKSAARRVPFESLPVGSTSTERPRQLIVSR